MKIKIKLSDLRINTSHMGMSYLALITDGEFELELMPAQLEQAYREREREYQRADARRHLLTELFDDEDYDYDAVDVERFYDEYGIRLPDALDPDHADYLLDAIVEKRNDEFFDCNVDENEQYRQAVSTVLEELKSSAAPKIEAILLQRGLDSGIESRDLAALAAMFGGGQLEVLRFEGDHAIAYGVILDSAAERIDYRIGRYDEFGEAVVAILNDAGLENESSIYDICGIRTKIAYSLWEADDE